MRDIGKTPDDVKDRITSWLFVLVMRLYGQNIYSDDSYIWKVFDLSSIEDIDSFFMNVLSDFKYKEADIARLYKSLNKKHDILSR
jgi:hypothetical protein